MLPLRGFCMHWRRFEAEERRIITNQWIYYLSSQFCKVDNVQWWVMMVLVAWQQLPVHT
jgi:hypothetical protein